MAILTGFPPSNGVTSWGFGHHYFATGPRRNMWIIRYWNRHMVYKCKCGKEFVELLGHSGVCEKCRKS